MSEDNKLEYITFFNNFTNMYTDNNMSYDEKYKKALFVAKQLFNLNKEIFDGTTEIITIKLSDCILEYPKNVLTKQSDVFKSMLDSKMKEGTEKCIDMTAHTPCVVKALLDYLCTRSEVIYTKKTVGLIFELLNLTEMYQITDYKDHIIKILLVECETLTFDSSTEFILYCTKYPTVTEPIRKYVLKKFVSKLSWHLGLCSTMYNDFSVLPTCAQKELAEMLKLYVEINMDNPVTKLFCPKTND